MAAEYLPVNLSERVQARLLSQVGENIKDILDSTRENVQLHISEGMAAGDGAAQLGDRVEQAGAFSELRAETIARTETATLLNRAAMASYREFGVTQVQVIDGDDDEECAAANGQTWTLEEAEANPIEHPNCVRDFSPIIGEPAETPEDAAPAEEEAAPAEALPAESLTQAEAEQRLADLGVNANIATLGADHRGDVVQALEQLATRSPDEFKSVQLSIDVRAVNPQEFAHTAFPIRGLTAPEAAEKIKRVEATITLNQKYFGPRSGSKLAEAMTKSMDEGWLGGNDAKYVMDHEFGHIVDQQHGATRYGTWSYGRYMKDAGTAPTLYGKSNRGERFAEAFAMHQRGFTGGGPFEDAVRDLIE